MAFVFLNTIGGSELGVADAKAMRAHITRTNFAKRRQRLQAERWRTSTGIRTTAAARASQRPSTSIAHAATSHEAARWSDLPLKSPPIEPYQLAQFRGCFSSPSCYHLTDT
jgi:hypothetical protein